MSQDQTTPDTSPERVEEWAASLAANGRPGLAKLLRILNAERAQLQAAVARLRDAAAVYHDNPPIDLSWKVRMKSMHDIAQEALGNE